MAQNDTVPLDKRLKTRITMHYFYPLFPHSSTSSSFFYGLHNFSGVIGLVLVCVLDKTTIQLFYRFKHWCTSTSSVSHMKDFFFSHYLDIFTFILHWLVEFPSVQCTTAMVWVCPCIALKVNYMKICFGVYPCPHRM